MSTDDRTTVAVVFGGVSPEHEVSVISAHQVLAAMDTSRFRAVPVYVGKDGQWYVGDGLSNLDAYADLDRLRSSATPVSIASGGYGQALLFGMDRRGFFRRRTPALTVDVMFLAFHGGSGENGAMQGLCECLGVAYTGSGVLASALGMDKVVSKQLCREAGIPVVEYFGVNEWEWAGSEDDWLDRSEREIGYPVIVKPARLGSSIGIEVAKDRVTLDRVIEEAFRYDSKIVLERAVKQLKEINCSVLGSSDNIRLSVLEQPVRSDDDLLLTFEDKYQRSSQASGAKGARRGKSVPSESSGMASLDRIIPARLDPGKEQEIQKIARAVFRLFDCSGVARIDFLIDEKTDEVFFNEINTIPGSFSFYLWEPAGVDFPALVNELVDVALRRHRAEGARVRSYDVNLLSEGSLSGLKGAKRNTDG